MFSVELINFSSYSSNRTSKSSRCLFVTSLLSPDTPWRSPKCSKECSFKCCWATQFQSPSKWIHWSATGFKAFFKASCPQEICHPFLRLSTSEQLQISKLEWIAVIIHDVPSNTHCRTVHRDSAVKGYHTPKCTVDVTEPEQTHLRMSTEVHHELLIDTSSLLLNSEMEEPCLAVSIKLWQKLCYSGCTAVQNCHVSSALLPPQHGQRCHIMLWVDMSMFLWLHEWAQELAFDWENLFQKNLFIRKGHQRQGLCSSIIWGLVCIKHTQNNLHLMICTS